jgi:hypothetical protein
VFPAGEDEIGSSPKDDGVEYIDTGSKRKKGPPRKRSLKSQLKNARAQANEINRLAIDKLGDIHRMKAGVEKDIRMDDLVKLGKEIHFLEPGAEELKAPAEEIKQSEIEKASKVPILTHQ